MECAENYNIVIANHPERNPLDLDSFSYPDSLYNDIVNSDGYNDCSLISSNDPYKEFLSWIRCYEKDLARDKDDHDIYWLKESELYAIVDTLRNGDYIFIIDDFGKDITE